MSNALETTLRRELSYPSYDYIFDVTDAVLRQKLLLYPENDVLYLLKDDGNEISVQKKDGFTFYLADDYDEKYIISTQIW